MRGTALAASDMPAHQGKGTEVGSSGKHRTTMAKLNREGKLREKRVEKQARKAARKLSASRDAAQAPSRSEGLDTASGRRDGGGPGAAGPELVAAAS